jgi:outer membrane protein TolC
MMTTKVTLAILTACLITLTCAVSSVAQTPADTIRLGYLEGGKFTVYDHLRVELFRQLQHLAPPDTTFTFVPWGYGHADWKQDSCRTLARTLHANPDFDIMIAIGPWTVEALLDAGFTRPIVALHRFAPDLEGIIDADNRPVVSNLTVHHMPNRLESDIYALARLIDLDTLAVLFFPSAEETDPLLSRLATLGDQLGFEVISGSGVNNFGTFAPFRAYTDIRRRAEAIYMPTMAGLTEDQIVRFCERVAEDRTPIFTSEGLPIVELGAMASNSGFTCFSEARFNAAKILDIARGATPADLQVTFDGETGLSLNEAVAERARLEIPQTVMRAAHIVPKPADPAATRYTLNDAIRRVLTHNPDYLMQLERIEAAARAAGEVRSRLWPHLGAQLEAGYADNHYVHNHYDEIDNTWLAGRLWLRQPLLSLETLRTAGIADRQTKLAQTDMAIVKQQLELATTTACLGYLSAAEQQRFLAEHRQILDRVADITRAFVQLGDSLSSHALRAESERHQASASLAIAQTEVTGATIILNALFNLPGNTPLAIDTTAFAEDRLWLDFQRVSELAPSSLRRQYLVNQLVKVALTQSPRTAKSDLAVDLSRRRIATNTARYYPRLDLDAELSWADSLRSRNGFDDRQPSWTVRGVLSVPLYLGGSRSQERARLRAELSEQEYARDAASLRIMQTARTRAERCLVQLDNLQPLILSADLARRHLSQTIFEFERGEAGLSDLMDALSHHQHAGLRAIRARYDYLNTLATLVYEAGFTPYDNGHTFHREFFRWLSETFRR